MDGASSGGVQLKWMAEADSRGRGTMPPSLARACVRAASVIAMQHSLGMQCSSGSRLCLVLCSLCCETHHCHGARCHGTEPSCPTCVCPYPICQLWQLCVWGDKCVSVCILSRPNICDSGKEFNLRIICKSSGNSFILKLVEDSTYYWAKWALQPNHDITNDRDWRIHDDGSNCHFAIQKQFLQVLDREASPFHKRHVIHQPIDLQETWKRKHCPSHHSCMKRTVCLLRCANNF